MVDLEKVEVKCDLDSSTVSTAEEKSQIYVRTRPWKSFQYIEKLSEIVTNTYFSRIQVQKDASDFGISAVLSQYNDEGDKVISYLSRFQSVLYAIEKFRPYIEEIKFSAIQIIAL